MSKKGRIVGFYEVKPKDVNVRVVAELKSNGFYYLCGISNGYLESDFTYIGEEPIISNKE
jgi:hypothetical protein